MKIKRRTYLINTRLQMRFSLFFILISLIGNVLAVTVFNTLAMQKMDTLMWSTHISIASTDELIRPVFIYVNVINILFVTVLLVLTGVLMLKKTSGPLFRMSSDIKKVTAGDLSSRIVLRQKDEFTDVADELNSMIEKLRDRFAEIHKKCSETSASVELLKKGMSKEDDPVKKCNAVLEGIKGIETEISKFEL